MAGMRTTVKLDARAVDEAVKVLDAKSRTDAVHTALKEIVAMHRFRKLMNKDGGKLKLC